MSLMDALVELGVPDSTDLEGLNTFGDDLYARVNQADLDDFDSVAEAARACAPEFVALAEAAARANDAHATDLLAAAAGALPNLQNLAFLDAADVALSSPRFLSAHGQPLAGALAERVRVTQASDGLQAYAYLEALTRLGLTQDSARFAALGAMSAVTLDDASEFLERLPRLVGLAYDHWREGVLESLLSTLAEHPEARADALFELGQAGLRTALEAPSLELVLQGVGVALDRFVAAEALDEARDDATIYRCALQVLVAFAQAPASTSDLSDGTIDALTKAMNRRVMFTSRSALGGWAEPRRQAEAEWYALAVTLRAAIGPLEQASWLTPVETLSRVLAAYQASRSVTAVSADGLRVVLEPTVHAAFLRREGLLEHLRASLDAGEVDEDFIGAAQQLLAELSSGDGVRGGGDLGKVLTAVPALAAEMGADADERVVEQLSRAIEETPELMAQLNAAADERRRARARSGDAVVDDLLGRVVDQLEGLDDFKGIAREEFVALVTEVLRFAADRADIGRQSGGPMVAYLFPAPAGESFTEDFLQRDVYSWLCSSGFRPHVRMEERDIAAGRADVTVQRVEHRFVIEVKREQSNSAHDALVASYGPQTAGYTVVGPSLSISLVLDLTDHSHGVPSLRDSTWVDSVAIAGGSPRTIVTVVVRGNRPTPREILR